MFELPGPAMLLLDAVAKVYVGFAYGIGFCLALLLSDKFNAKFKK